MEKFLQIETQKFLDFYDKSTPEVRESLKPLFGNQIIEYLCFKIKSYEDACEYLYNTYIEINIPDRKATAYSKLLTIIKALNDGWTENGVYFYPEFSIEDNKFELKQIKQGGWTDSFPFSNAFKFRDAELAKYCAEKFIDLFKEVYI